MSVPDVAVVILNFNGKAFLEKFLPGVLQHSVDHKIYVADNASTDDSVAFLRAHFPQVNIILNTENSGYAKVYNTALKKIKADYYVLLNSDVEVTSNWIEPVICDGLAAGRGQDLVGLYAAGPVMRGFANSLGQRNWHESASFELGWSNYLRGDKAVKSSYAGTRWDDAAFAGRAALDQPVHRAVSNGALQLDDLTPRQCARILGSPRCRIFQSRLTLEFGPGMRAGWFGRLSESLNSHA